MAPIRSCARIQLAAQTHTHQFIRKVQPFKQGVMAIGDQLTLFDNALNQIYKHPMTLIDCKDMLLCSESAVYVLEDTLTPFFPGKDIICIARHHQFVFTGHEDGWLSIYHGSQKLERLQWHADDITYLDIQEGHLLSSSTDGTFNLLNLSFLGTTGTYNEDDFDEAACEMVSVNVEVSVQFAKLIGKQIIVVTDMNQLMIWDTNGNKQMDFGFLTSLIYGEYRVQSIIDVHDHFVFCCLESGGRYHIGLLTVVMQQLVFTAISETSFDEIVRSVALCGETLVSATEDGVVSFFTL